MKSKLLPVVFLFAAVLLVPGSALGNSPNDMEQQQPDAYFDGNKLEPDFEDLPHPMQEHIDTNETTLQQVRDTLEAHTSETIDYGLDESLIPINFILKDNDKIIVGLDPIALYAGMDITEDELRILTNSNAPIEIQYMDIQLDASKRVVDSWKTYYKKYCDPPTSRYAKACTYWDKQLRNEGINPRTLVGDGQPIVTKPSFRNVDINFEGGKVKLTWDISGKQPVKYKIYKYIDGDKQRGYNTVRTDSFTMNSQPDTLYKFKILAYYKDANNRTKTVSYTTNSERSPQPELEYEIENIRAKKDDRRNKITVSWEKASDFPIKYYKIYIYQDENGRIKKSTVNSSSTSYSYNVDAGYSYYFKIYLYYYDENNRLKSKVYNSPRVLLSSDVPSNFTLSGLKAAKASDNQIKMSWNDPPYPIKYYKIYEIKDGVEKTPVRTSSTSYTFYVEDDTSYKFKVSAHYRATGYDASKSFYTNTVVMPPICTADQKLVNNTCVDRCPADNERWDGAKCLVTSCPDNHIIQNNSCVACAENQQVENNQCVDLPPQCPAGNLERGDPICSLIERTHSNDVVRGGERIYLNGTLTDKSTGILYSNQTALGSIGLALKNSTGSLGFITAAHVPAFYQAINFSVSGFDDPTDIGGNINSTFTPGIASIPADASFVELVNDDVRVLPEIIQYNDQIYRVDSYGGYADLNELESVLKIAGGSQKFIDSTVLGNIFGINPSGIDSQGTIYFRDNAFVLLDFSYDIIHNGKVVDSHVEWVPVHNVIISDYDSNPGDSGGAVFHEDRDGNIHFIGIHNGRVCEVKFTDGTLPARSTIDVNGIPICNKRYSVLSPWESFATELGLE